MSKPRIFAAADQDILHIFADIAKDNFTAAMDVHKAIDESIKFLVENPLAGPKGEFDNPNAADCRLAGKILQEVCDLLSPDE